MYLVYFLFWVLLNAKWNLEIVLFGIVIAAAIFWFTCAFMDYSIKKEILLWKRFGRFCVYVCVLIREVMLANWDVIKRILSQKEEIQPEIVTFDAKVESKVGRALLANSITLTPGTITVSLDKDGYIVHCLDEDLAAGMDDSAFVHCIQKIEERK